MTRCLKSFFDEKTRSSTKTVKIISWPLIRASNCLAVLAKTILARTDEVGAPWGKEHWYVVSLVSILATSHVKPFSIRA